MVRQSKHSCTKCGSMYRHDNHCNKCGGYQPVPDSFYESYSEPVQPEYEIVVVNGRKRKYLKSGDDN